MHAQGWEPPKNKLKLQVALIQMLKAFTPVIVMVGLVLAKIELVCVFSRGACQN
jgi:hypothetical protein